MRTPSARNGPRRGNAPVLLLGALLTFAGLAVLGSVLLTLSPSSGRLSAVLHDGSSRTPSTGPDPWTGAAVRLPIEQDAESLSSPPGPDPARSDRSPSGAAPSAGAQTSAPPRAVEPKGSRPGETPLRIQDVVVERSPDGGESLAIRATAPFTPDVFPLEGENPFGSPLRLVVDVNNVASVAGSVGGRDLNGQVLKRVRTAFSPEERSFRAVLDLDPDTPHRIDRSVSEDGSFVLHLRHPIQIRAITFRPPDGSGKERLLIQADRFFEPVVFGLEGANPYGEEARIVVDIPGVRPPAEEAQRIPIGDGRLVRGVRTHYHATSGKLRVVLDLAPAAGYTASQAFFEKQNLYCLSVTETGMALQQASKRESRPPDLDGAYRPQRRPSDFSRNRQDVEQAVVPPDLLAMHTPVPRALRPLRSRAAELDEDRVRAMFQEHGFYSTCGIYNARYCNQDGDFTNRLRACGSGVICDDATGLMWEQSGSDRPMTWGDAAAHIRERNHRRVGGHDDWRLPTLEELLSLMERSWGEGGLYVSDLFDAAPGSCWSGDTRGDTRAWKVNYHLGYAVDALVEEQNWVRAVRSADPASTLAGGPPSTPAPAETPVMDRQARWR